MAPLSFEGRSQKSARWPCEAAAHNGKDNPSLVLRAATNLPRLGVKKGKAPALHPGASRALARESREEERE